jgi:hypothetical protein
LRVVRVALAVLSWPLVRRLILVGLEESVRMLEALEELVELPKILGALAVLLELLRMLGALEEQRVLEERKTELVLLQELVEPVEPQLDAFQLAAGAVAVERLVMV